MTVLATRLFMERAKRHGRSYVVGMYDLQEAFYSALLQLIHQILGEEHELEDVLHSVEVPAWIVPQVLRLLFAPGPL
eukprot:8408772-Pyramimonas_sp.AAC.1